MCYTQERILGTAMVKVQLMAAVVDLLPYPDDGSYVDHPASESIL